MTDSKSLFPFLSISRQTGAGGHLLAETLLEAMMKNPDRELFAGWSVFDAKECQAMLENARFRVTFPWLKEEMYRTNLADFFYQVFGDQSPQMDVMAKIFKTIRHRAQQGKVIFIGRGATHLTQSLRLGIRIRLIAPLSERIDRVASAHHISHPEARRLILKRDRARAWLLRHYFEEDIEDPALYHAVYNTAIVPVEDIARILIERIQSTWERPVQHRVKANAVSRR